jgi:hypothetical protein
MSSERDSFAKGIFSTFVKGFLLHKLLLKVNFSPLRVKKSRSHDMGHFCVVSTVVPSTTPARAFCLKWEESIFWTAKKGPLKGQPRRFFEDLIGQFSDHSGGG